MEETMPRKIKIAAVQMTRIYGEIEANLAKAEQLVDQAVAAGAQLVVLPELFDSGYAYTPSNYEIAGTRTGRTYTWMLDTAARAGVHLAGSFLLRKDGEIYNTLLLAAPDGRTWEYDKLHPWGWECAYFHAGHAPVVADTGLGKIGFLICYDVTHPDLFAAYAGKVQLLVISSSPPHIDRLKIRLPGGEIENVWAGRGALDKAMSSAAGVFDADLRAQAAWLGVPALNAMPGKEAFSSGVPRPRTSLFASTWFMPKYWPYIVRAQDAIVETDYYDDTMIIGAGGEILARAELADDVAVAEIEIPDAPPQPARPQPRMALHPLTKFASSMLGWISKPEYKQHK
jgi:predicted amidohydrolase